MKNTKKILALLLALVMMMTLFVGCGEKAADDGHDHSHEAETETEAELEPAELVMGHHTNAYGLQSFSVHYTPTASGDEFDYMNEDGKLISLSQEEVDALLNQVVATCGDYTLNNKMLALAYQEQYYQFYQAYGMYMMLMMDGSKGLDEQVGADGTNTWQYMFVEAGATMFHRLAAVGMEVKAVGFDLTDAQEKLAQGRKNLEDSAAQVGYTDLKKFASDYFGPGITLDDYLAFLEMQSVFNSYTEHLQSLVEVTEDEIDAYWAENEQTLTENNGLKKIDKNVVDVRHILIAPEETTAEDGTTSISEEAWAAAEAKAKTIYEQWKSGEATEESFAELVPQHTEDPGSAQTGGLYEDVYPGQMVETFDAWCYEDGRQVGDHGIVKTDYGYHIMYFSGEGDYVYWRKTVKDMIISTAVSEQLTEIDAKYPVERDLTKAVILDTTAPTVPAVEEETEAEQPVEEHVHTEACEH